MSDWLIGGLIVLALIVLFVFAWRTEPRGPGTRFRRRSMFFGGRIGEGSYRGVDAKKRREAADETGGRPDP